jgi:hypothetical protein
MCWYSFFRQAFGLGLLVTASTFALAQETGSSDTSRPWAIGLAVQTDEDNSESVYTNLNWGVTENTWLFFAAGQSSSPAARANIETTNLIAGLDQDFGLFGASFEIEQWGDRGSLESFGYRGSFYLDLERFHIGVEAEQREIDLTFTIIGPRDRVINRTTDLNSDGLGIFFGADLTDWWRVYGSAREYDYSRNLNILPRLDVLNFLSSSTLTLANSFLEDDTRIGFEWTAGRSLINLSFGKNHSAVDDTELNSVNASVLFPISYRMDLELNLGRSKFQSFEPTAYGGVMLLIYGGG